MLHLFRVGLIVPSSNTTMEVEVPDLMRRHEIGHRGIARFTFHSSRMRMRRVSQEELAEMDAESERCAGELSDACCDVLSYACLVGIMEGGPRYHLVAEGRLRRVREQNGCRAPVVISAGALVDGVHALDPRRAVPASSAGPHKIAGVIFVQPAGVSPTPEHRLPAIVTADSGYHAPSIYLSKLRTFSPQVPAPG